MPLVFQMKQIKPAALKRDALRLQLLTAVRDAEREIKKDFQQTTKTWKNKPKFESIVSLKDGPSVIVGTDNEIYTYVDEGTRPHPIVARRAKSLAFRWGGKGSYRAKTQVRVIDSFSGGATGKTVFPKAVQHPGTKARKFADEIEKRRRPWYKRRMEQAMRDAAKSSGHGG